MPKWWCQNPRKEASKHPGVFHFCMQIQMWICGHITLREHFVSYCLIILILMVYLMDQDAFIIPWCWVMHLTQLKKKTLKRSSNEKNRWHCNIVKTTPCNEYWQGDKRHRCSSLVCGQHWNVCSYIIIKTASNSSDTLAQGHCPVVYTVKAKFAIHYYSIYATLGFSKNSEWITIVDWR